MSEGLEFEEFAVFGVEFAGAVQSSDRSNSDTRNLEERRVRE